MNLIHHQAIKGKKLFILDYYDDFIPYLRLINTTAADDISSKVHPRAYATRTILFLKNDGTLKPLAIELSLPKEGNFDVTPQVYLPSEEGVEKWVWLLAKAYVVVNDSNYHQLISHWYFYLSSFTFFLFLFQDFSLVSDYSCLVIIS